MFASKNKTLIDTIIDIIIDWKMRLLKVIDHKKIINDKSLNNQHGFNGRSYIEKKILAKKVAL